MLKREISGHMLIEDIVDHYPSTIKVFMQRCLHCIGCPISHHHTVADCARENELDLDGLLTELNEHVRSQTASERA